MNPGLARMLVCCNAVVLDLKAKRYLTIYSYFMYKTCFLTVVQKYADMLEEHPRSCNNYFICKQTDDF